MLKTIKQQILDKFNISVDQLLLLELLFFKEYTEIEHYIPRLAQTYDIMVQNLFRRDFIKLYDENITGMKNVRNLCVSLKGENVIKALRDIKWESNQEIIITTESCFNEFWDAFPSSDKWASFPLTRALKADKNGCNKRYSKLLVEEGYKHEDVMTALEYQKNLFKKNSTMIENKMKFFQNSATWLNQKTFLEYLELSKEEQIENNEKGLTL